MKSNKIKQLAVKGLANGKLKLGRVRPKSIGFFWNKGVTMYGAPRPVMMSELELKLVYNKDNFIELPAVWDGSNSTRDVVYVPTHDGDITVNLTTCDVLGFRPMTNEEMLNSLKAGHRPAVMSQGHLMQEVLNHGSEVMSAMWIEDNTFLLNTATTYYINIAEGYILIDNRKYKFELEDVSLRLDVDGDWVSTHVESKNLVCYANTSIGTIIYKEIKILGEL